MPGGTPSAFASRSIVSSGGERWPRSSIETYETEIPIRISDVNYGGHLGNDAVLSLAHEARVRFLALRGFSEKDVEGVGIMMVDAAVVYGPQKGATPDDVVTLDAVLAHWADVVDAATGRPDVRNRAGAGAAGGVGYAAMAVLGAELEPGIGLVLDLVRFADHLPGATLVITGEGVDLCDFDPGHPVAATVESDLGTLTRVWRGDLSWKQALHTGGLLLHGTTQTRRIVPQWLKLSAFAAVPRPA